MKLQNVTTNLSSAIRHDTMEGREYLVAPMVMLTEGVHKGSNGPLYYPEDELSKTPEAWNHKPVVVYHPTMHGMGVSACDPDIITKRKVGVIMNTRFDSKTGKLRAEAWLEKDRISEIDNRISDSLENNSIMEVSTGLFTDNQIEDGEYNGKPYSSVARNYRPDHLALLPDKKGACSIEDGAGLLQLNSAEQSSLSVAVSENFDGAVFKDVVSSCLVFEKGDQTWQCNFTMNDDSSIVFDRQSLEDVSRQMSEDQVETFTEEGEKEMANNLVDALISNEEAGFDEKDREGLLTLNAETLEKVQKLISNDEEASEEQEEEEKEEDAVEECADSEDKTCDAVEEEVPVENSEPLSAEQYVSNAPPQIRDMLESGLAAHNRDRQALIDVIVANEKNVFEKSQLAEKPMSELKGLAALAAPEEKPVPSYAGASAPSPVANSQTDEEHLLIPTINWSDSDS